MLSYMSTSAVSEDGDAVKPLGKSFQTVYTMLSCLRILDSNSPESLLSFSHTINLSLSKYAHVSRFICKVSLDSSC